MKTLKQVITTILIATILICCKEEKVTTTNIIDETKTASIQGFAYASLDITTPELEAVPAGTTLKFLIDSRQFAHVVVAGYTYQTLSYTTTVGAGGAYSVKVPALTGPISVQIVGTDFRSDVKVTNGTTPTFNKNVRFGLPPVTVTAVQDLTTIADLQYR